MTGLASPLPSTVRVGGAELPVSCGWRANVGADLIDRTTPEGQRDILYALLSDCRGYLPRSAAERPREAVEAVVAWHDGAMRCMGYGRLARGARGRGATRPVLDWEADAAIVVADFMRFYGIDLTSADSDGIHWYRFCILLTGLLRTDGSLVGQAAYARSPHPGARGEEGKRLRRLAEAWALPPTDAELREMARARF